MKKITGLAIITWIAYLSCGNHYDNPNVEQYLAVAQPQIDTDSVHRVILPPSKRNIYPPDSPHRPDRIIDMDTMKIPLRTDSMHDSSLYHK